MGRKGKRKRIARNCYEDATGRSCIIRDPRTGKQKEFRHPPYTPVAFMRDQADKWAAKRRKGNARVRNHRGTLAAAVEQWTPLEQHLTSWKERLSELRAWVALYGDVPLLQLTEEDCRTAVSAWATADPPVAPKTIRNRLWSLRRLYHVLLGKDTETPVDHIDPPAKVRTVPIHVSPALILQVYAQLLEQERTGRLRDRKTRARFMVRASTGRRPSEIMRAQPEDVDLERRVWKVRDGKGGWSEGVYLNDDMLAAWRLFAESDAWGPFSTWSMAEVLRTAGWPERVRPYSLRHSLGIDLSEGGADLHDVGPFLGHTSLQTTRSVYVPVLRSRMQRLSQQVEGRLSGWAVPVTCASTSCHEVPQVAPSKGPEQKPSQRGKQAKSA